MRLTQLFQRLLERNKTIWSLENKTWSRRSKGFGVGKVFLELLNLREGNFRRSSNSLDVLEGIGDAVRSRSSGRIANRQGNGSDIADSAEELGLDVFLRDVENVRRVDRSSIVAADDVQTVSEGRDLQHVEKRGGGFTDFVAFVDQVDGGGDFDVSTGDLGRHGKSLEERCFLGTESCDLFWVLDIKQFLGAKKILEPFLWRDNDRNRSNSASSSSSWDLEAHDQIADLLHVAIEANKTDIELDQVGQFLELGLILVQLAHGFLHHGVFAHENFTLAPET